MIESTQQLILIWACFSIQVCRLELLQRLQHQMEKILQGIPNIACYLDDDTEHVMTLDNK